MEPTVHDLVRLREPGDFVSRGPVPIWVDEALSRAPWVVVRRAPMEDKFIPVGVRGRSRNERFPGLIHSSSIVERLSPECLSSSRAWEKAVRRDELPAMRALPLVHATFQTSGLLWGPVGSVGFELATHVPVAHWTSDLDLIIRLADFVIPPVTTTKLLAILQAAEIRIDVLLETMEGAIPLLEFVGDEPNLILRSINGPRLVARYSG